MINAWKALEVVESSRLKEQLGEHHETVKMALRILWMIECAYIHLHTAPLSPSKVRDWVYEFKKKVLFR